MGVLFFVVNAVFALVIILMVMWVSAWALMSKNPENRYQPMRDDRGSFIKSQGSLGGATNQELDALGASARGDAFAEQKRRELEENSTSSSAHVNQMSGNPMSTEKYEGHNGLNNENGPYGGGYNPVAAHSQQFRQQNSSSPNPWQRGVGY